MDQLSEKKENNYKIVFFDLETSHCNGVGSIFNQFNRIVQISAVCGEESFDAVVNPECHIPSDSAKIHGILDEVAKEKEVFSKVFPKFRSFVKDKLTRGSIVVLVAHNAFGFDKFILEKECARIGVRVPLDWVFFDSLLEYRKRFPNLPSKRLPDIYEERFKEKLDNAHNALADSSALQRLFERDLRDEFNLQKCLPANQQCYVADAACLTDLRGVGPVTYKRFLRKMQLQSCTVGDLRQHTMYMPLAQKEIFVRTILGVRNESFVFSVLCEITQCANPNEMFSYFPFVRHTFPSQFLTRTTVDYLLNAELRSPEQLKRYYVYGLEENGDDWERFVEDKLDTSSYIIAMIMRSV